MIEQILAAALVLTTPILLAAIGGLINRQSGIVNIAGDGVLTALQLASELAETGKSMSELAGVMQRFPQVLLNVTGVDRTAVDGNEVLATEVAAAEAKLGETGRVLLRPSGTEPVIRVMVEAESADQAEELAEHLSSVVRAELSL